ncbi:MAG: glutamate carboxypeptidase [Alteromonadaceae bacterium]|jgi:glutamate carboxypeptidase
MKKWILCAAALLLANTSANLCYAVTLTKAESTLVKHIDSDKAQSLALLEQTVNINSGTMNFAGVKLVGDVFAKELQTIGLTTQWIDGKPFDRAGHLFASYNSPDKNAPKILMIGHLDTVFSKDSPVQKYLKVDKQWVKGPGIIDMKGGDVIIVYVLKALKDAGLLNKFSIQVVMMGDEEKRGRPIKLAAKV